MNKIPFPFLRLVLRESTVSVRVLVLMAALSGLANMLVLAVVNDVVREINQSSSGAGEASSGLAPGRAATGQARPETGEARSRTGQARPGIGQARPGTGQARPGTGETGETSSRTGETGSAVGEALSGGLGDFLAFLVVVLLFVFSQRYTVITTFRAVEDAVQRLRVRLGRKISACELAAIEKVGRGAIYGSLSRDTEVLSELAVQVIYGAQMGILVVFVGIYLAFVSWLAFFLVAAFIAGAGFIIISQRKMGFESMKAAAASGNVLLESMTHLLDGLKEVKLNLRRREHVLKEVGSISLDARDAKMAARKTFTDYVVFTQMAFYVMLGILMFVVPKLTSSFSQDAVQVSTALLFIMNPILGFTGSVSVIETVNRAAESIERMEKILDDNASASTERADGAALALESLAVHHLEFDYRDAEGAPLFRLGPLDLEIAAGETVFFVGGNGSGKSTLLKLLTSLYEPRSGSLLVNRSPLLDENRQSFREQVGAVFSDYHLFGRLYGLEHVTDAQANEMIDSLGLHGKTRVVDGKFETLDLSGGQRKRLGFLVALLEDRPILVLDEVAADQDPDFRRRFYDEILPELQRMGKTLLLATHDDLYFHAADRLVVLDEGQIREIVEQRQRT